MKKMIVRRRKMIIITLSSILVLSLAFILYYFLIYTNNYLFRLNGSDYMQIPVFSSYIENGATAKIDDKDLTNEIIIDSSELNINVIGIYKIKYSLITGSKEIIIYREVEVIDNSAPEISLNGSKEITILIGDTYEELGCIVTDNYDTNLNDKVVITDNIDTSKEGTYPVTYTVKDTSGNKSSIERTVIVKKPVTVVVNAEEEKVVINKPTYSSSNGVTVNKWTDTGIYLEGYIANSNNNYKIKLVDSNNNSFEYTMTSVSSTEYRGDIALNTLENGSYKMYIVSNNEEQLLNELTTLSKIVRAKVGSKLITFSYDNKYMTFKVEDFAYQYDIFIDPGHGSTDPGAINALGIRESDMNLKISLYEKCRYEAHNLTVFMTRTTNNLFTLMGDASMKDLHKRAYTMGYYSVVSRVNYSNHHNASNSTSVSGFEILTPAALSYSQLQTEHNIYNSFLNIYNLTDSHKRFYTRSNDTNVIYSMLDGQIYTFDDYYAVIRIPYMLYHTKEVIFEGIYMTNMTDFNWYWTNNNWVSVSEVKIEEYVKFLGGTYNSDNSSCSSYM